MAWQGFDIKGFTTVGGNVELKYTSANANNIAMLCNRHIPVIPGAQKPLYKSLTTASHIHGKNGMGSLILESSNRSYPPISAIDFINEQANQYPGELRILTLGPMTNIGGALLKYPELSKKIHSLVCMGGSIGTGNVTPAAEYNIYADPDAAKIVFESGIHVTMVGLNVTLATVVTPEDNKKIKKINNKVAQVVASLNDYSLSKKTPFNTNGAIMHDPLAAALYMDPSLLETKYYPVEVDCRDGLTRGATLVDRYGVSNKAPNVHVAVFADNAKFMALLYKTLAAYDIDHLF
jgi:pyrimidine-specific ribonucleoside hydrolase